MINRFLNFLNALKSRRNYQRNWGLLPKKVVAEWPMVARTSYFNLILTSSFSRSHVRTGGWGSKSGTWQFCRILNRSFWKRAYKPYFPQEIESLSLSSEKSIGGVANDIDRLRILEFRNVIYSPLSHKVNGLNMFTFRIQPNKFWFSRKPKNNLLHLDSAVTVEVGGSESFQHFVQDCLPLITFIKQKTDLFDSNTILIKELKPSSESILLILELLFPELDFIYLNKSTVFSINCLKVISFHPKNYVFSLPREVVSSLNREVEKMNLTMDISNSLIFLDRGRQKSRNIENIDDLFRALKTFLNQKGFDFVVIDTSSAPLKGSIPTIRTAKIILGVHGGSMYNAIFAHKDAVIMELLPTINTDSVANLFVDLGFRYAPIFLDYDKSDKSFQVPIDLVLLELESILKGLHV